MPSGAGSSCTHTRVFSGARSGSGSRVEQRVREGEGKPPGDELDHALALDVGPVRVEGAADDLERVVQSWAGDFGGGQPTGLGAGADMKGLPQGR